MNALVCFPRDEVERLRGIRDSKEEIHQLHCALAFLRQEQRPERNPDQERRVTSPCQAEGGRSEGRGKWRQVLARRNGQKLSLCTSLSQVPLYNRYEALDVVGESMDD